MDSSSSLSIGKPKAAGNVTTTSTDTSTSANLSSRAKDGSYYIIQKVFQDIAAAQFRAKPSSAANASATTASKRPEKHKAPPSTVQPDGSVVMGGKVLYPLQQFQCQQKNTNNAGHRKPSPHPKTLTEQRKQPSVHETPSQASGVPKKHRQCSKVAEIKDLFESLTQKEEQLNEIMNYAPQMNNTKNRRRRTPGNSSSSGSGKLNTKSVASNAGVDRSSSRTSYPAIDVAKLRKKFIAEAWQQKITSAKKVLEGILENLQKDESYNIDIPDQRQQQKQPMANSQMPSTTRASRRTSTGLPKQKKRKNSADKQRKLMDIQKSTKRLPKCDSESVLPDASKLQLYEEAMSKWENPERSSSEIYRHSIKLKRKFANTQLNPELARQQQKQQHQQQKQQQKQEQQQHYSKSKASQVAKSIQKLLEHRLRSASKKQPINSSKMNFLPTSEPPVTPPQKHNKNNNKLPFGVSYTKMPSAKGDSQKHSSAQPPDPSLNHVFATLSTQALMQTSILSKLDNIESVVHSWQQTQKELMVLKEDNSRLKEQVQGLRDKLEVSNALLRKLYFSTIQNSLRGATKEVDTTVISSASMKTTQNRQVIMQLLEKWANENVGYERPVSPRLSGGASEDQTSGGIYVSLSDSG